ncbi:MAG: response regulator [Dyadobacter sp.]|uniref:response regulator n=1 Tax=Dyadobacter sp. TaxID=1914288 RepID=UPI0032646E15
MKTIYLADDDEDDRMLIRDAIERVIDDVEVIEVEDGEKLLSMIKAHGTWQHPVLILMDMNMPRQSGLETLAFLKSMPQCAHIPVLMMSTISNQDMIDQAHELGIDDCLIKPVNEEEFTSLAETVDNSFAHLTPLHKHIPKTQVTRGWNAARWNNELRNVPHFGWKTATYSKKR